MMTIVPSLFLMSFPSVYASTEPTGITQIPSEPTDYPDNNNDTLQILFSKATISDNDSVHVVGSIKNVGQQALESVDVTAHFFDADNNTVGVTTCCYADPSDIEPGHTSSFDSFSSSEQMTGVPTYYRLSFDWQNGDSNSGADAVSSEAANNLACNSITTDFTLTSDLYCPSDGLNIINQNGLTIDLNNYTITGPGIQNENAGIRMEESSNIVITGPGIIEGFHHGISNTNGDTNKISAVTFTQNEAAIFDTKSENTQIEDNLFFSNNIGYAAHSSNNARIITNLFKSNDLAGITLINSKGNEIAFNTIQGSVSGIFIERQSIDNEVNSNNVIDNTGVDLNNANGLPVESTHNSFFDNNCNSSVPNGLCLGK